MYSHATALGPREDALLLGTNHVPKSGSGILEHARVYIPSPLVPTQGGADRAPVLQDEISAVNLRDIRSALQSNPVVVEQVEELNGDITSDRSSSDAGRPVRFLLQNINDLLPLPVQREPSQPSRDSHLH